jgi:hypothetical protein
VIAFVEERSSGGCTPGSSFWAKAPARRTCSPRALEQAPHTAVCADPPPPVDEPCGPRDCRFASVPIVSGRVIQALLNVVPPGSRHAGRGGPRSARRSGRGGLLSTRKAGRTPRAGLRRALPAMEVSPVRPFAEKEAPALAGLRPIFGGPKVRSTPGRLALVTQSGGSGWRSASRRSWRGRPGRPLRSQAASSPSADD